MTPKLRREGSTWRLAPGLGPTEIPTAIRNVLGTDGPPGLAAHHIVGGDGGTLDPQRAHVTIDRGEMVCGSCGHAFQVPHIDLTLHGFVDKTSSAYLECPHCQGAIRLTGIEDPTVPKEQGHWITTAQLTEPAGHHGAGWAEFRTAELAIAAEEPSAVVAPRPLPQPAQVKGPNRWPLMLGVAALLIAGIALAFVAASSEQLNMLIVAATLLAFGIAGVTFVAVRLIADRRISVVAILAVLAVVAGTLVPATGAVMRCRSLSPGSDLSACDLSGKDLSGRDLAGADLSKTNLTDANLTDARLNGANLTGARLRGADLTGAKLEDANLSALRLAGATLTGIEAPGADFAGADLSGVDLTDADLTGADLSAADLSAAILTGADLTGADLRSTSFNSATATGAVFGGADLSDVDMSEATFENAILTGITATGLDANGVNLRGAQLQDATISESSLRDSDLDGADLTGAQLKADLSSASANETIFVGADLSGSVLTGIEARGADLRNATLAAADLEGAGLSGADLSGARIFDANLSSADLTGATFAGATLGSTDLRGTKGLTDEMLGDALGTSESGLVAAVVRNDLRFESPGAITRALRGVPKGDGVSEARAYHASPAFHPIVVLSGSGTTGLGSVIDGAAGVWAPPGLRFAELAATEKTTDQVIETCPYNVHPIDRHRSVLNVSIFSAASGKLVAHRTFYGPPARACQFTELVSTWDLRGGSVNYKRDVLPWLKQLVNPVRGV